jgi:hypothetical protein
MRCVKKEFKNHEIAINDNHYILKEFYNLYITQNTDESIMENNRYRRFYYDSEVWCVNNKNTTLVTRRNGKVSIQGNCKGQGVDITAGSREENEKLFNHIKDNLPFTELGWEGNGSWIHVGYNGNNNKEIFSA